MAPPSCRAAASRAERSAARELASADGTASDALAAIVSASSMARSSMQSSPVAGSVTKVPRDIAPWRCKSAMCEPGSKDDRTLDNVATGG
jgi:hypothetical protein